MDEQRAAGPVEAPSDGAGIPTEPRPPAAPPRWSHRGAIGVAVALVLAFVWGGLAYRELGPSGRALAATVPTAVRGSEAPPGWISDFATAFCDGDADTLATRIGPPLSGNVEAIKEALQDRDWSCSAMRFIGGGSNPKGSFYVYVMRDKGNSEQWWVFTAVGQQVVAIE
jgi:hypothetical protein